MNQDAKKLLTPEQFDALVALIESAANLPLRNEKVQHPTVIESIEKNYDRKKRAARDALVGSS